MEVVCGVSKRMPESQEELLTLMKQHEKLWKNVMTATMITTMNTTITAVSLRLPSDVCLIA